MKKFSRIRHSEELKSMCAAQGLEFDDFDYLMGGDCIKIKGGGATVTYNTCNGRFQGVTPDGIVFDSNSHHYDDEDWFKALLNFFYAD